MTLQLHDPAYPTTPGEKAFALIDDDLEIEIHPMDRHDGGVDDYSVSITLGQIGAFRDPIKDRSDEFFIISVNRSDFVDGLLAVFPELTRAPLRGSSGNE